VFNLAAGRAEGPLKSELPEAAPKEPFMGLVYDIVKDRRVYSIEADSTVLEAARFMMEHSIGALPVLRNGEIIGIFSERDVMNRVVAAGRMPGTTKVSEVMTANPKAISVDETIENCLFLMREFGFRHLPITDGKQLKGLV
jgi:CBS domain-containing protein